MKAFMHLMAILIVSVLLSCEKEKNNNNNSTINVQPVSIAQLNGYVQKGPYLNGTTVTLAEMKGDFIPTGKNYNAQILDNKGTFNFNGLELESQYASLQANGFYFNEVSGENSQAQLTLQALTDLSDSTDINVNVLTTLEKRRVEYLIAEGSSFTDAKSQAQSEVLKIFGFAPSGMNVSEKLDIAKAGNDNAVLLAVSVILQGMRTEAGLSELLANISSDIRTDGELNDSTLGMALITDVNLINMTTVRENIEARYQELGVEASIGTFEKYINDFKATSEYTAHSGVEYPENGDYGSNLLAVGRTNYPHYNGSENTTVSFAAKLNKGTSVKVGFYPDFYIDTIAEGWFNDTIDMDSLIIEKKYASWSYAPFSNEGWEYTDYEPETASIIFTSDTEAGQIDLKFFLTGTGSATLEIYENNSDTITRIKKIYWTDE
ncbi:MAG: hypothetical protein GVY19_11980 [Bacteroidetes bacterium]|jgi:hypothetical protein|nr:hypothetical protein [Bacteroidota bacterium]